jgi:hypothetical protein
MIPLWLQFLMYLSVVMTFAVLVWTVRQMVLEIRAEHKLIRLLATHPEYRPLLHGLGMRIQQQGNAFPISEHEAIDLREQVRRAAACLSPADQKRIAQGLYGPTVVGREAYLRSVLAASMQRVQQQAA